MLNLEITLISHLIYIEFFFYNTTYAFNVIVFLFNSQAKQYKNM
jgi:hypothetical protein